MIFVLNHMKSPDCPPLAVGRETVRLSAAEFYHVSLRHELRFFEPRGPQFSCKPCNKFRDLWLLGDAKLQLVELAGRSLAPRRPAPVGRCSPAGRDPRLLKKWSVSAAPRTPEITHTEYFNPRRTFAAAGDTIKRRGGWCKKI